MIGLFCSIGQFRQTMMQIAMMGDFPTAYPANWRLTRSGIKERT